MIGELLIVGAIVSALVQWIKNIPASNNKAVSLTILVVISIAAALIAQAITYYGFWEQFLGILASASTIYAFFVQHLEDKGIV